MKIQNYIAIAIRFISLIIMLFGLRMVFWYFYSGNQSGGNATLTVSFIWIGFSLICWFLPQTIAQLICGSVKDAEVKAIDASSFLRVLIIFLGFYFIINSIFDLTRVIYQFAFANEIYGPEFTNQLKVSFGIVSFQLITGLFLVAKNYWITKSLLKINTPEKAEDNQSEN